MILSRKRERKPISSEIDWQHLMSEIRDIIQFTSLDDSELYYEISNSYSLPLHLSYLIIRSIREDRELSLDNLSSVSYYAICRDILIPYKNKTLTFRNFYNISYPYLKSTDERLEWFLKHHNGLSLTQKIELLEEDTSYTSTGIGRGRLENIIARLNLRATKEEIERRRYERYDGNWAGSIASFIPKERGDDLTAAEIILVGDYMADDSGVKVKMDVMTSLIARMGKIEVYFLATVINRFHDRISRTSSLQRAMSSVFEVELKTIQRLVSMHSMVDLAQLIQDNKVLEQFERIIPFRTFRPMLAAKWEQQYNFPMYAEAKFDGVRLLVHKLGNRIACFSRRRKNYNFKYGAISELLNFIPAYSVILDGEIIALQWTPSGVRYLSVYELHEAINQDNHAIQLVYVIFDILYLNGVELTDYSFEDRRKLRNQLVRAMLVKGQPTGITYREVENYKINSKEQLIWAYNKFVDQGLEGAIVKPSFGTYELGTRSQNWLKLKPKETLDVVITGVVPKQSLRGLMVWGVRYAAVKEDEYFNMGIIRGMSTDVGNRLAELLMLRGLIPENTELVDLREGIEGSPSRFTQTKETLGFEIEPNIVITIDSLGVVKRGDRVKLRNARFLHIREDKPPSEASNYYDIYHNYMTDESYAGYE